MRHHVFRFLLVLMLFFTSCSNVGPLRQIPETASGQGSTPIRVTASDRRAAEPVPGPSTDPYINKVIRQTVDKITTRGMDEYEKAKAAFDYLIENTYFEKPVGLDVWRIRGSGEAAPPYVENKCLSVLLYGPGRV